jgi:hypothetical protein
MGGKDILITAAILLAWCLGIAICLAIYGGLVELAFAAFSAIGDLLRDRSRCERCGHYRP